MYIVYMPDSLLKNGANAIVQSSIKQGTENALGASLGKDNQNKSSGQDALPSNTSDENIRTATDNPIIESKDTVSDQSQSQSQDTSEADQAAETETKTITGEASYTYVDTPEGPKKIEVILNPTTSGGSKRQSKKRKSKRKAKRKSKKRKSTKRKSKKKL